MWDRNMLRDLENRLVVATGNGGVGGDGLGIWDYKIQTITYT